LLGLYPDYELAYTQFDALVKGSERMFLTSLAERGWNQYETEWSEYKKIDNNEFITPLAKKIIEKYGIVKIKNYMSINIPHYRRSKLFALIVELLGNMN
jgi:hypothetical protein